MEKRKIIFGDYDTSAMGWTLAEWSLSPPVVVTQYIDIPGRDGSLDLSDALTDGIPRYHDREFSARLECSDGTRMERETLIRDMVNRLDGWKIEIRLPDDDDHYITGRVSVSRLYNDPAHGAVLVTAVCQPWLERTEMTEYSVTAAQIEQTLVLRNAGRRAVCPVLTVAGAGADVRIAYRNFSYAMSEGSYQLPDLLLTTGEHIVTYSGTGTLTVRYREAVLA
jgi:hypothetical protein